MCRRSEFHINTQRGFTLLELLVVVSTIVILAALVWLVRGDEFTNKASDVKLKTEMEQLQRLASAYYLEYGRYGTNLDVSWDDDVMSCAGHSTAVDASTDSRSLDNTMFGENALDGADSTTVRDMAARVWFAAGGTESAFLSTNPGVVPRVYCAVAIAGGAWAFAAPLSNPSNPNGGWCVDSAGAAKEINADLTINYGLTTHPLLTGGVAQCP